MDADLFDAEHDLKRGDKTAKRRIRLNREARSKVSRAWHKAVGAAEYHADKLDELADAPDAAAAADAVNRWGLLSGRRDPKPFPSVESSVPLPTATDRDLHAAVKRAVGGFFAEADAGAKPRTLVVSQTGSRKTGISLAELHDAIEHRKAAGKSHRAVWLVPEHKLSNEALKRATHARILAAVFRGRSEATCQNLEAVKLARQAGADIKSAVCGPTKDGSCFARNWCSSEGYFSGLSKAADADMVIAAHNFLTDPLPKSIAHDVAWVIVDEDFTALMDFEREITRETLTAEALERSPVRGENGQTDQAATAELAGHYKVIHRAVSACIGGYTTPEALQDAGFGSIDPHRTTRLVWDRKVPVQMHAGMDPDARKEAARLAAVNSQLSGLVRLTEALERVASGDPAAAGLVSVRLDERRGGSQVVVTVRGQRKLATWLCDLPVLMLSATGRIEDVRRTFPDATAAEIARAAEPYSTVRQIVGGFGRSTLARHKTRLAELRDFITVTSMGKETGLVVTHKSAEDAFAGMPGLSTAHFGAITGHDGYRNVDTAFVIGGAFASPEAVASLAAARGAGAVDVAKPERVTRPALLKSGAAVEIEVMAYSDPAVDMVHRGIYDTSIIQAAGRPRPLERIADNPAVTYAFANVALPFPVDSVARWQDVRPDRVVRMVAGEAVWTNAADMTAFRPDLFRTRRSAEQARKRAVGSISDMRAAVIALVSNDVRRWVEITFQPTGQGQKPRSVFCPEGAEKAVRYAVEVEYGEPEIWRVRPMTNGKDVHVAGKNENIAAVMSFPDTPYGVCDMFPHAIKSADFGAIPATPPPLDTGGSDRVCRWTAVK